GHLQPEGPAVKLRAMRRLTLLVPVLVLALASVLVPLSAGAQTTTQTVTVNFTNGLIPNLAVDVYMGGTLRATDLAFGETFEVVVPAVETSIDVFSGGSSIGGSFPWEEPYQNHGGQNVATVLSHTDVGVGLRSFPLSTNPAHN